VIVGNLVDVRDRRVFPARIHEEDGVISQVEEVEGQFDGFLIPGLIDSHIHTESSLLCPSRFAEAVVPHGTTAVVANPHEIANVMGLEGIGYMAKDSATVPLRFYFTAPSCVPTTKFETSGARIGPAEMEEMLSRDDFVALGEVTDYPAAIERDPEVMALIDVAKRLNKPIDGHGPLLTGEELRKYVSLGITTDHECNSSEEALEKASLGMKIMVREGSVSKDMRALASFAKEHEFFLVSDDVSADELAGGHLNKELAQAVSLGIDPVHALRAATINPALHYGLPIGAIEPGRKADIVKVKDLKSFEVEEVHIGGQTVARMGVALFDVRPKEMVNVLPLQRKVPSDFEVMSAGKGPVRARVIGLVKDELITESLVAELQVVNDRVVPDVDGDILHVSVVNRYQDAPASSAFVKGFGLKAGAIASSVAHDSHNIIAVGADSDDMAIAVNMIIQEGGGFCVCSSGKCSSLNLRVAGLMCTKPAPEVKRVLDRLHDEASALGCPLESPFMTMSFLSLLVIPKLKLSDKGLFDVTDFRFVDVIMPDPSHSLEVVY
jgi:adenine deaminase